MSTSDLEEVLTSAVDALERLGVTYHVTGGLASSYYGEPRLTQDIDFVIRLEPYASEDLVRELDQQFLIDSDEARLAVSSEDMFQALHRERLIKVDFHVGEDIEGELDRSQSVELFSSHPVRLVSKEDAILSKLLWAQKGSEKSRHDTLGMLLDPTPFDEELVMRKAKALGCSEILEEVQRRAREIR